MDTQPPPNSNSEPGDPISEPAPQPATHKYHLVLFQPYDAPPFLKHGNLERDVVDYIQNQLDVVVTTPPESTEIDVWIESPGGDAHAAYKLVLDLRHRCRKMRVIIPDVAKSAATLFALGADQILMAAAAELGPLDAQIEHPAKENVIVSALDVADSFEFIGTTAIELAISGGAGMLMVTGLPRVDVLNAVLQFTARMLSPAVEKLDPHLIHRAANQIHVAERYAVALLSGRRHQSTMMTPDAQETLVMKLVNEYPAHGFVISRADARKSGIQVEAAEADPRWSAVKQVHKVFRASETKRALIFVIRNENLDKFVRLMIGSAYEAEEPGPKPEGQQQDGADDTEPPSARPEGARGP